MRVTLAVPVVFVAASGATHAQCPDISSNPPEQYTLCVDDVSSRDIWDEPGSPDVPAHYIVYPPDTLTSDHPVLVLFHEGGAVNQADIQACDTNYRPGSSRHWLPHEELGSQGISIMEAAAAEDFFAVSVQGAPGSGEWNFGGPQSMKGVEEALEQFLDDFGDCVDRDKIYGVGHSFGGFNLLAYAGRNLDPDGAAGMLAGFVLLSARTSTSSWWDASPGARNLILACIGVNNAGPCPCPCGSTFAHDTAPFPFQATSAAFTVCDNIGMTLIPSESLGRNLLNTPGRGLMHDDENVAGPLREMPLLNTLFTSSYTHVDWDYKDTATFSGAAPAGCINQGVTNGHCWSLYETMSRPSVFGQRLWSFLDNQDLSQNFPGSGTVLVVEDGRYWYHYQIERTNPDALGFFTWEVKLTGNRLILGEDDQGNTEWDNIDSVRVRTVDSSVPITPTYNSGLRAVGENLKVIFKPASIASTLEVTLEGYASAPTRVTRREPGSPLSQILVSGTHYFHDAAAETLRLRQTAETVQQNWTVVP